MKHLDKFFLVATMLVTVLVMVFYFKGDTAKAQQGVFILLPLLFMTATDAWASSLRSNDSPKKP